MRINIKKYSARILVIMLLMSIMPTNLAFAATSSNLVLHYDMTHSGTTLKDVTGNGHDASMVNITDSNFTTGSEGTALNFDATSKYVKLPKGIIQGETFTIESTFKTATSADHWLWTLGTTATTWPNVKNYLFINPMSAQSGYSGKVLGGIKDANTELRSGPLTPKATELNTVTAVFNNGALTIYLNGTAAATINSGYSIQSMLAANSTADCIGYIGRSLYSPDPYYKGKLFDFKVYNTALTGSEVQSNYDVNQAKYLNLAKDNLTINNIDKVFGNLTLPTTGDYNTQITWASSDTSIISNTGVVSKPATDTDVTLTATLKLGAYNVQKAFTANVKSDIGILNLAKDNLNVNNINNVLGNLTLPTTGDYNAQVTWKSSDSSVITDTAVGNTPAGVVTRQSSDTTVTLTATMTLNSISVQKVFTANVKAKAPEVKTSNYLFAYFIGQNTANEEQMYFAGSTDGLNWDELNGGKPVLTSSMGEKGVRDPFIMRSPEGDKFYLIATDLSIYNRNGNWGGAQTAGSQYIMVWESTDLVNWSNQRMVKIGSNDAGCTWAPEVSYDESTGEYIVFWASKVGSDNYAKQRMYYSKTRDFYTFTAPQIWLQESYSVIDCTVIKDEMTGYYYRFTKNESSTYIYLERSKSLMGTFEKVTQWKNITGAEGPTAYNLNGTDEWILLVDYFGSGGYYPYSIKDFSAPSYSTLTAGTYSLPSKPRHGTVMPITAEEYKNVMMAYGNGQWDYSNVPSTVIQGDDSSVFPTSMNLIFGGIADAKKAYDINWNITANTFANVGLVTVTGAAKSDPTKTVTKEVLVVRKNTNYFVDSAKDLTKADSDNYKTLASRTTLLNSVPDQAYDGTWGHTSYIGYKNTQNLGINNSGLFGASDGSVNPTYKVTLNAGKYALDSMQYEWWTGPRTTEVHAIYTDSNGNKQDVTLGNSTVSSSSKIGMVSGEFTIDKDNTEVTIIFKGTSGQAGVVSYFAIADLEPKVTTVNSISDISVANGTDMNSIGLPKTINVELSTLSTTSAAVAWDNGSPTYDGNTAGTYKFTGTLTLANGFINPNNLKASVNVIVQAQNVIPAGGTTTPVVSTTTPAAVRIIGIEKVGNMLSAELLDGNQQVTTTSGAVTYEWYRQISKDSQESTLVGINKTYNLVSSDLGNYIKLVVSYVGKTFEDITSIIENIVKSSSSSKSSSTSTDSSASNTDTSENSNSSTTTNDGWKINTDNTMVYIKDGKSTTGWNQIDGSWYLMDSTGIVQNGWKQTNDTWYLLKNDGVMATGWQKSNNEWYYLKENGAMATGWQQSNSKWYYLKENGAMATGWQQSNNKWYYLKENGDMATDWILTNNQWYYLYSDGAMASNTVIDGYKVTESGAWAE